MTDAATGNYEIAEAIAPTWERRRAQIEEVMTPVRAWMVRELRPRVGDTVLELAAGVGDTGFDAAELIGEHGRLVSSDLSPAMVDAARRRGSERGVENAEYGVWDAGRIELAADSVDGVLCRLGYMLMPDPAAALVETCRVLRPGGRLALAVWAGPEQNPFFAIVATGLVRRGHVPPPDPSPASGIFSMATPQRVHDLLHAAGFHAVRTEEVAVRFPVPDVDEYIEFEADTAGPIGLVLRRLSAGDRAALKADVEKSFQPFATGGKYELPGLALCAVASQAPIHR